MRSSIPLSRFFGKSSSKSFALSPRASVKLQLWYLLVGLKCSASLVLESEPKPVSNEKNTIRQNYWTLVLSI